ncbi:MAG TPA: hypothetical protein DEB39_16180 [Planctomycetaceae bacterium]|nr:hypothetical protein [Planctomycetaceae bacterium]
MNHPRLRHHSFPLWLSSALLPVCFAGCTVLSTERGPQAVKEGFLEKTVNTFRRYPPENTEDVYVTHGETPHRHIAENTPDDAVTPTSPKKRAPSTQQGVQQAAKQAAKQGVKPAGTVPEKEKPVRSRSESGTVAVSRKNGMAQENGVDPDRVSPHAQALAQLQAQLDARQAQLAAKASSPGPSSYMGSHTDSDAGSPEATVEEMLRAAAQLAAQETGNDDSIPAQVAFAEGPGTVPTPVDDSPTASPRNPANPGGDDKTVAETVNATVDATVVSRKPLQSETEAKAGNEATAEQKTAGQVAHNTAPLPPSVDTDVKSSKTIVNKKDMLAQPDAVAEGARPESGSFAGMRHRHSPPYEEPDRSESIVPQGRFSPLSGTPSLLDSTGDYGDDSSYSGRITRTVFNHRPENAPAFSQASYHAPVGNAVGNNTIGRNTIGGVFDRADSNRPGLSSGHMRGDSSMRGQAGRNWEESARLAAEMLRDQIESNPASRRTSQDEARLRLFEAILGNPRESARPIKSLEPSERNFWANEMLGISAFLDDTNYMEDRDRRAAVAYYREEASKEFKTLCPLKIRNMQFVADCQGFGSINAHAGDYLAGQMVHLYLELDNLTVRETAGGFATRMNASYEICDGESRIVKHEKNVEAVGNSSSFRRDHYLCLSLELPENLAPGNYTLRLSICDQQHDSHQTAEEQISFRVRSRLVD